VSGVEGGEGRPQADGPRHAVDDQVGRRPGGDLRSGVGSGEQLRHRELAAVVTLSLRRGVERELEVLDGRAPRHRDDLDAELERLRGDDVGSPTARRQPHDPEPVGVGADHVDGLRADRPGGAEQHDVAGHPAIVPQRT
jgi:hypothetical protein